MAVGTTRNGDVRLAYELIGDPSADPLLLVMGLGGQLVDWPDGFCAELAERGFAVARFDNRDSGESTHLSHARTPSQVEMLFRPRKRPPYRLEDMAADSFAVMDALGWERAHLVGSSLGGMIAQTMAIEHPDWVLSLTSISSTPCWRFNCPRAGVLLRIAWSARHRVTTPGEAAREAVLVNRLVGSKGYPFDEDGVRDRARRAFERGADPDGVTRQAAAVAAGYDRRPLLRSLKVPALVLHGEDDPAIRVRWGRETADAISGSRFLGFAGMGHDLPEPLWPDFAEAVRTVADCANDS